MNFTTFLNHHPIVQSFFDNNTNTISHVVVDSNTNKCAVIDSVLDYEPHGATVSYESAEKITHYVKENKLEVQWILETHVHADHLTAAKYIQKQCGGKIAISSSIVAVQKVFSSVFNEDSSFQTDGSQFDILLMPDQIFTVGSIPATALHVPGHTPADMAFIIGDSIFVGDTIFMPDMGSARSDFPGGSAAQLYDSAQKILELPPSMNMYMCHDYLPESRTTFAWHTTVGEQKEKNVHLASGISKNEFILRREQRDGELGMPRLIIPALQVNMRGGDLPKNTDGETYLKIPVNNIFSKQVNNA